MASQIEGSLLGSSGSSAGLIVIMTHVDMHTERFVIGSEEKDDQLFTTCHQTEEA